MSEHIDHLLTAYIHQQLSPALKTQVAHHLQRCDHCRAALDQELSIGRELRDWMPAIGKPNKEQLTVLWSSVRQDRRHGLSWRWADGFPFTLIAMGLFIVVIACMVIFVQGPLPAIAAPVSPQQIQVTWTPYLTERPTDSSVQLISSEVAVTSIPTLLSTLPASPAPIAILNR